MKKPVVLIVEDNEMYAKCIMLQFSFCDCHHFSKIGPVSKFLKNCKVDLALIDLQLGAGEKSGVDILPQLVSEKIPTVILSGSDRQQIIEECYNLGCFEFIRKGDEKFALPYIIKKYLSTQTSEIEKSFFENHYFTSDANQKNNISAAFPSIASDTPILIFGETGTGKSHLARALHKVSERSGEFSEINCANLSPLLAESELFGHTKGSFTGASDSKIGLLEKVNNGTIFLDEIASLDISTQAKLLKAIEEKSFFPVGAIKSVKSNFKIISACNVSLEELMVTGKFRSDLYYRLNGVKIELIPLRDRQVDIIPLINQLLMPRVPSFTPEAKSLINSHEWRGNIRELQFFVQNLSENYSGRINEEIVSKILNPCAQNYNTPPSSLETIFRQAVNIGLEQTTLELEQKVFSKVRMQLNNSMPKIMQTLKISKRKYYSLLNFKSFPSQKVPASSPENSSRWAGRIVK